MGELKGDQERLSRNGHSGRQSTDSGLMTGTAQESLEVRRIVVEIVRLKGNK